MIFLGLDPGVAGGIAAVDAAGRVVFAVHMPATEADLLQTLQHQDQHRQARAVLERVSASPQMGVVSAFTFGKGYGGLRMALAATAIPFDEVSPIRWQNALGCRTGGDKNISKRRAEQLFPGYRITHACADALLLAEYCRRSELGLWRTEAPKAKRASRRASPLLESVS